MIDTFPPGLILILGAAGVPFTRGTARSVLLLGSPLLMLWLVWQVGDGAPGSLSLLGFRLVPVFGDALGRLFATIFSIMAFAGALFALNQHRTLELAAAFLYAGSAVGVALAGDLVALFVFWELMALGSTLVLLAAGERRSAAVAMRYLLVHVLGGQLLMAGILVHWLDTGSMALAALDASRPGPALILAGVLVNAAAPPLSAWLGDAYPEASWSGTVFLSAFTTKAAVYVLLRSFPGTEVLIYIGLFMIP